MSVRDLSEYDDFRLDEADYSLIGGRTKKKFRMGDKVRIKVVAANLTKRQLDYEWVADTKSTVKNAKGEKKGVGKASGKKKKV